MTNDTGLALGEIIEGLAIACIVWWIYRNGR